MGWDPQREADRRRAREAERLRAQADRRERETAARAPAPPQAPAADWRTWVVETAQILRIDLRRPEEVTLPADRHVSERAYHGPTTDSRALEHLRVLAPAGVPDETLARLARGLIRAIEQCLDGMTSPLPSSRPYFQEWARELDAKLGVNVETW